MYIQESVLQWDIQRPAKVSPEIAVKAANAVMVAVVYLGKLNSC
jgi:hypothetical protein